ncbi:MAG TPA: efflux RND transporter periplasmic adaptor subunit [Candidatus Sulfotelmatobacter sp.]|nr:efflux RND transporter periplasmic adaptor subunit [Candidatus Sulfotelmatobacter sp.]
MTTGCASATKSRAPRVPVAVARAESRSVPLTLAATGTVEPIQTAAVGSQVGGVVTRVAFREGDEVGQGQVLFELDPRPFRAALEQAEATLQKDRAQYESARLEADRAAKLVDQNLISQSEWDQDRATAEAAAASVRADSAAVITARLNLQYASIEAPISGKTGQLMVHVGNLIKAATSDPLVVINQIHPVRVHFTVPVGDVPLVQRYRDNHPMVEVRIPDSDTTVRRGALVFVDNAVDATTGTLLLKGEFENRDRALVPGQFVDVQLVLDVQKNKVVVPAPAVSRGQQGAFVYVLNADSTVAPRPVQVERSTDELAVLAGGVEPGETVITDGQLRLSPGAKVLVRAAKGGTP